MNKSLQVIDLALDQDVLRDFDSYSEHLFSIITEQFGFLSPMLFMLDDKKQSLVLTRSEQKLQFPVKDNPSVLAKSFTESQLLIASTLDEVLSGEASKEQEVSTMYIVLPVRVVDRTIGVLVFASQASTELSSLEKVFLQNFADQIGTHLLTTWALKHSVVERAILQEANTQYRGLIEVKKSFLVSVQELLLQYLEEADEEKKQSILQALEYLHSVVLLSEKTLMDTTVLHGNKTSD